MGKRILIISYFFAPQNAMGAVRPTKLAKYLSRMGHEVTVLCGPGMNDRRDPTLARDLAALREVHVIREWNPLRDRRARPATPAAGGTLRGTPGFCAGGASVKAQLKTVEPLRLP